MRRWIAILTALVMLSACSPGSSLPFSDNFDARNGWTLLENSQADIVIASGQLRITVKQPDSLAWSIAEGKTFADFTLDVEATPLSGPEDNDYGVIVRRVDDDNLYRFEISSDGYYNVQKRQKGQWEKLITDWTRSDAIHKGMTMNRLRVVCAGHTLTFYVNQIQLVQVTDATFARGQAGVFAGTLAQPNVQVAFDNLQVSR